MMKNIHNQWTNRFQPIEAYLNRILKEDPMKALAAKIPTTLRNIGKLNSGRHLMSTIMTVMLSSRPNLKAKRSK